MLLFKPKFWDKKYISFFSILLLPITFLIRMLIFIKKYFIKKHQFSIPVLCVGNIYLGGTGKTPLSIEIFKILKDLNMKPAFIRKKYDSYQDEVKLQEQVGSVFQNKKRAEAIKEAIDKKKNVVILDDGLQDISIKKNLSIVCFNEQQWIGNGLTIPSGPLRESLSAIKKANLVIINGKKNINIEQKILSKNKEIKIFYTKHTAQNIHHFENKKVISFAGIGNPENFFNLLKDNMVNIIEKIRFPDHYQYSKKDLENLINKKNEKNAILLTTEKDFLRIEENFKENINFLKIKTEFEDKNNFINEIKKFI